MPPAHICEHPTKRFATLEAFGDKTLTRLPRNKSGRPLYCVWCINNMSCRCADCKRAIFVGDPVRIFASRHVDIEEHVEIFATHPLRLIGCMREDCAPATGLFSGLWSAGPEKRGYSSDVTCGEATYAKALKSWRRTGFLG